jgi:hypothetical protein
MPSLARTARNGTVARVLCTILPNESESPAELTQPRTSRRELVCPQGGAGEN